MACTGIHALDPICQLGNTAGNAANDAFSKIAGYFGQAAASATDWLWNQLDEATAVNLSSAGVSRDLVATGSIAIILCTCLFLIQILAAVLRQEPGGLVRAVRGLLVAIVASTFAIAATKIVLAAVDDLSAGVVRFAIGTSIDGLGSRFALAEGLSSMSNPAGMLLFSLVILVAVVMVWGAMMIRKMLIIVAAVMTPMAFAGGAADITHSWVRRWIEFTAALIASKLLLVIILMVGLSVFEGAGLHSTGASQTATQLATGSVLLLLAGLAPFMGIKMFHFAGDSLHSVHAQASAARAGTEPIVAAPRKVNGMASQARLLGANLSGPAGTGAAGDRQSSSEPSSGTKPQTPRPVASDHQETPAGSGRAQPITEPSLRSGARSTGSPQQRSEPGQAAVPTSPQR